MNDFYDGFYEGWWGTKNVKGHDAHKGYNKHDITSRRNYRDRVLEYLRLEFCDIGDWWHLPISGVNINRVLLISLINDCQNDNMKINNASGVVYEWLKGRNLI